MFTYKSSEDIWSCFDTMFNDFDLFWKDEETNFQKTFNEAYSGFPPTDVFIKKDRTLVLELAVSGYTEDQIDLDTHGDKLIINLTKKEDPEKKDKKFLSKGIKHSSSKSSYFIPPDKYKIDEVNAKLKDGILKIEIPAKDEIKPKNIKIEKE